jgi:hypothetical protein
MDEEDKKDTYKHWMKRMMNCFNPSSLSMYINLTVFICAAFSFLPNIFHNNISPIYISSLANNSTIIESVSTDDYYATLAETFALLDSSQVMISLAFSVGAAGINFFL